MFTRVNELSDPSMMIVKGYIRFYVKTNKRSGDKVNSGKILLKCFGSLKYSERNVKWRIFILV